MTIQQDYTVLEKQYANVCAVCNTQSAELRAFHDALQELADAAKAADRLMNYTFKNARDVHARTEHAIEQARRLIGGEAIGVHVFKHTTEG